jgi:hypothetical protein
MEHHRIGGVISRNLSGMMALLLQFLQASGG